MAEPAAFHTVEMEYGIMFYAHHRMVDMGVSQMLEAIKAGRYSIPDDMEPLELVLRQQAWYFRRCHPKGNA